MPINTKKAVSTARLLSRYAKHLQTNGVLFRTAFFANDPSLYAAEPIREFLAVYDALVPYVRKHPLSYLEAENVYWRIASALSLQAMAPLRYETVYYEFSKNESAAFDKLSLTLPIFEDENDYVVYSIDNDTYQYGFYHYGKLREGDPMGICPSGRLLIRLETQKQKRPHMFLIGDAFAPFLASYMAHHYDICMHAPLKNAARLSHDFSSFRPDVLMLLGGITLLENDILSRAFFS